MQYKSGDIKGYLTLLKDPYVDIYTSKNGKSRKCSVVQLQCRCGKVFITRYETFKTLTNISCGCYSHNILKEKLKNPSTNPSYKHGLLKHPLRICWQKCKDICYNKNSKKFIPNIEMCQLWKNDFKIFYRSEERRVGKECRL